MCGITGFWGDPGPPESYPPILEAMVRSLSHRGPDGNGHWFDPTRGIGLGHTRLAVVDLSPAGRQPMFSPDQRYVLIYNGEAYNYASVAAELEAQGHAPPTGWRGHSDTEVVLAALAAWGPEKALNKFIGMFAGALWDRDNRTLTLFRDRMGIKPLYFGYAGKSLVFGSELKALKAFPDFHGRIDPAALSLYLRYLYIPAPYSIYLGIYKLDPGSFITFTEDDKDMFRLPHAQKWWDLEEKIIAGFHNPLSGDEHEIAGQLEALLLDSVKQRLLSDVPLGAFLSGGVDSSLVAALMQKVSSGPVKTFSIGSTEPEYDEAQNAGRVAKHLGTDHTELYVRPLEARRVVTLLPKYYDEPFADASQIPTYLVSRLARKHVTVSLSGDGGDELFAGYTRYLTAPSLWNKIHLLPMPARRLAMKALMNGGERVLAGLYGPLSLLLPARKRHQIFQDKLQKVSESLCAPNRYAFFHSLVSYWKEDNMPAHAGSQYLEETKFFNHDARLKDLGFPGWMSAVDQLTYLPDDILTKLDRASMAVSLEGRVPLLDHRLVEFAARIPMRMKIRKGRSKYLLRKVLAKYVPPSLTEGPKQGFGLPIDSWLKGPLRPWAEKLLDPKLLNSQGLIKSGPVVKAWNEHMRGKRNRQYQLWAVLMFQAWLDEHHTRK